MIKDTLKQIELYKNVIPCWDQVNKVLSQNDLEKKEKGKHELSDGCFYIVAEYGSKIFQEGKFEFHRKYIDIQILLDGEEVIYNTPLERMEPDTEGFNNEKDIQFGSASEYDTLLMKKGDMAVLYPGDAHYPGCRAGDEPSQVKKMVIKVPAEK